MRDTRHSSRLKDAVFSSREISARILEWMSSNETHLLLRGHFRLQDGQPKALQAGISMPDFNARLSDPQPEFTLGSRP